MARQRNGSTAMVQSPQDQYSTIADYLMSKQKAIAQIAPKYLDSERMIRLALGAVSRNPRLLQCSPRSWLMSLMDCAYYGLEPNPVLGLAYLIPYQNNKLQGRPYEVQFMAGYKGLVLLATDGDLAPLSDVEARLVREGEEFEETPEDAMKPFRHRPRYDLDVDAPIIGAYAVGWRSPALRPKFRFMPKQEIDSRRARSKAKNSGPWVSDYNAMAMKTAIRGMLSHLGMRPGSKIGVLLDQENNSERGDVIRAQDWKVPGETPAGAPMGRADQLAADLAEQQRQLDEEPEVVDDNDIPFEPEG